MKRCLFLAALLVLVPSVAVGKRAASRMPVQSAAVAEVVLVGTVTDIDKDPLEAASAPGATDKIAYTAATVKVTDAIKGLKTETHVKVGYTPSARSPLNLAEKQTYLLFLTKHHSGNFYVMNYMSPPQTLTADTKSTVDDVKAVGKIFADPEKALNADKAEDQALAALVLITSYRSPSESGAAQSLEAVPLVESQRILKALGAIDWGKSQQVGGFDCIQAIYRLGLGETHGWKQPAFKPGENGAAAMHAAFGMWLAGAGAKFQIQKYVVKAK